MDNERELLAKGLKKRKKKIKVDGKEYDLSEFDDTRGWSKTKRR